MEPLKKITLKVDCVDLGDNVICTIFFEVMENVKIYDIKRHLESLESFIVFTHATLLFNGEKVQENIYINDLLQGCFDKDLYLKCNGSRLAKPIINRNKTYFFDGKTFYEAVFESQDRIEVTEETYEYIWQGIRSLVRNVSAMFFKTIIFILIMGQHLSKEKILMMFCIFAFLLIYLTLVSFFKSQSSESIFRDIHARLVSNHDGSFKIYFLTFLSFLFSLLPFDNFLIE